MSEMKYEENDNYDILLDNLMFRYEQQKDRYQRLMDKSQNITLFISILFSIISISVVFLFNADLFDFSTLDNFVILMIVSFYSINISLIICVMMFSIKTQEIQRFLFAYDKDKFLLTSNKRNISHKEVFLRTVNNCGSEIAKLCKENALCLKKAIYFFKMIFYYEVVALIELISYILFHSKPVNVATYVILHTIYVIVVIVFYNKLLKKDKEEEKV